MPSDALLHTCRLTWVSLTLDEGYLFMAAPPDLERGAAPPGPPAPAQLGIVDLKIKLGGSLPYNYALSSFLILHCCYNQDSRS